MISRLLGWFFAGGRQTSLTIYADLSRSDTPNSESQTKEVTLNDLVQLSIVHIVAGVLCLTLTTVQVVLLLKRGGAGFQPFGYIVTVIWAALGLRFLYRAYSEIKE